VGSVRTEKAVRSAFLCDGGREAGDVRAYRCPQRAAVDDDRLAVAGVTASVAPGRQSKAKRRQRRKPILHEVAAD
jgi:hypothetical protein